MGVKPRQALVARDEVMTIEEYAHQLEDKLQWISMVTIFVAAAAAIVAAVTLRNVATQLAVSNDSKRKDQIITLLSIEKEVMIAAERLNRVEKELQEKAGSEGGRTGDGRSIAALHEQTTKEYLESLNDFCSIIILESINNSELRSDYLELVSDAVRRINDDKSYDKRKYRNIFRVSVIWADR